LGDRINSPPDEQDRRQSLDPGRIGVRLPSDGLALKALIDPSPALTA
jgi:hypothetical protein